MKCSVTWFELTSFAEIYFIEKGPKTWNLTVFSWCSWNVRCINDISFEFFLLNSDISLYDILGYIQFSKSKVKQKTEFRVEVILRANLSWHAYKCESCMTFYKVKISSENMTCASPFLLDGNVRQKKKMVFSYFMILFKLEPSGMQYLVRQGHIRLKIAHKLMVTKLHDYKMVFKF